MTAMGTSWGAAPCAPHLRKHSCGPYPRRATWSRAACAISRLQYTDESGVVKPLERGILSVKVTGGRLLGLGSACPYNETGYITDRTDTYYGEALAVVQAGEGAELTLAVTDGRYAGSVTIPVIR